MAQHSHSLQRRLILTLAAGLLVVAAVAIVTLAELLSVIRAHEHLADHSYKVRAAVDGINIDFKRQVQEWKNLLLRARNAADVNRYWGQFETLHEEVQTGSQTLLATLPETEVKTRVQQFALAHAELLKNYSRGRQTFAEANFSPAAGDAAVTGIDRPASQAILELSKWIATQTHAEEQALAEQSDGIMVELIAQLLIAAGLTCAAVVWALRRQLVRPLALLSEQVRHIAHGDFTRSIAHTGHDELGALATDLENMKRDLARMITGISTSAAALQTASGGLTRASDTIHQSTTETENLSGQIATAITQMAHTINDVAGNAALAAEATQTADRSAQEGLSAMGRTLKAIGNAAADVASIAADITKLERDTTSVGAVLDVIKGIAEQTNLLALNAAIEAARAGEQGRGFAVVADEVRALARKTQESTQEIHHIITTVQNGAAAATIAMQAGTQKTAEAVNRAREAGDYFQSISGAVGNIREMNQQVAAAAEEQSVAAEQISRNVVSMNELAEKSQVSADQAREVIRGLEQTARDLKQIIDRFKLER